MKSKTPILDKYGLHPFGGYCTCFSNPYMRCEICSAANAQQERWAKLTKAELKQANKELKLAYPPTYDHEGR